MDLYENYENLTMRDVIPHHGMRYLAYSDGDMDVYFENDGGVYKKITDYKTLRAVMEANKEEAKYFDKTKRMGASVKVASMPSDVYFDLREMGVAEDSQEFNKWLNKSENAWARTNNLNI